MKRCSLALALLLIGCGGSLPAPPLTEHPLAAYAEVPYPPPAALAETVPDKPKADVVWVDGEWVFHGEGYVWRRGGWVTAPPKSKFAPWHSWYRSDGRLMMARGTWYDEQRQRLRPPRPATPAETPPNQVTSEFQTGR
ncbi:MAG: hypothetical protein EOO73_07845 [Myxococcales bacterium]|nr:MAG: hypothetical protein EOO73_07845 [Myxococcales bacterium]